VRRVVLLVAVIAGCGRSPSPEQVDLDLIHVKGANLRTDTIGEGKFAEQSTFVLVDCENASDSNVYVTLAGELSEKMGAVVGQLKLQSLWIPAHETRTFALVDTERKARPTADAAKILVKGASVDTPPPAHVENVKQTTVIDKVVVQGELINDSDRPGKVVVLASFHDARDSPMTRPFDIVELAAGEHKWVQFVGPERSVVGAVYVGDVAY
jgi:hypothetical protein